MKKVISHRGNVSGKNLLLENNPNYILNAINRGFDVEIDLWFTNDSFFLGHDFPKYEIKENFLNDKMWIHCKNLEAIERMSQTDLNWFWHQNDKVVLTSKKYLWCFPGIYLKNALVVQNEKPFIIDDKIFGVCTDYPLEWKLFFENGVPNEQ